MHVRTKTRNQSTRVCYNDYLNLDTLIFFFYIYKNTRRVHTYANNRITYNRH